MVLWRGKPHGGNQVYQKHCGQCLVIRSVCEHTGFIPGKKGILGFSVPPAQQFSPSLLLREFLPLSCKDSVPSYYDLLFSPQIKTLSWSPVGTDSWSLLKMTPLLAQGELATERTGAGSQQALIDNQHLFIQGRVICPAPTPFERLSFSPFPCAVTFNFSKSFLTCPLKSPPSHSNAHIWILRDLRHLCYWVVEGDCNVTLFI